MVVTTHFFGMQISHKFSSQMIELFRDTFCWLPLAHVLDNRVLVVHGGLFSKDGVKLSDIRSIDRHRQVQCSSAPFSCSLVQSSISVHAAASSNPCCLCSLVCNISGVCCQAKCAVDICCSMWCTNILWFASASVQLFGTVSALQQQVALTGFCRTIHSKSFHQLMMICAHVQGAA